MGTVAIMALLVFLMWRLVEIYDTAYKKEWYWKYKYKKHKIIKKLGLKRKSRNYSTPVVKGWSLDKPLNN